MPASLSRRCPPKVGERALGRRHFSKKFNLNAYGSAAASRCASGLAKRIDPSCRARRHLRGHEGPVEAIQKISPDQIVTSSITRYELTYGALRLGSKRQKIELAKIEKSLGLIDELPFQKTTAQIAARIRRELETKGLPFGPMDLQIAATALEAECVLDTGNERELGRIEGLRYENWMR